MMENKGPTLLSEFKRGLNLYNLSVGLFSSLAIALGTFFLIKSQTIKIPLEQLHFWTAIVFAIMFFLTTVLHTIAHSYFGWRFERGIKAFENKNYEKAIVLLTPVSWKGMDHYDLDGYTAEILSKSKDKLILA